MAYPETDACGAPSLCPGARTDGPGERGIGIGDMRPRGVAGTASPAGVGTGARGGVSKAADGGGAGGRRGRSTGTGTGDGRGLVGSTRGSR